MNFRLSWHAQDELMHRGILPHMVDDVLSNPQQVLDMPDGKLVVTVYRTSKIDKYWRTP